MTTEPIFLTHLVLGYLAWLLCFGAYILPWLRSLDQIAAHRVIATLHSFRFFGLAFVLPGVVGANLPSGFATAAAYGDFTTGVLAILALLAIKRHRLFWSFVVLFNLVGTVDLVLAYYHAIQAGVPAHAGELGVMYVIPILYVPLLMITHVTAVSFLLRRASTARREPGAHARSPA